MTETNELIPKQANSEDELTYQYEKNSSDNRQKVQTKNLKLKKFQSQQVSIDRHSLTPKL